MPTVIKAAVIVAVLSTLLVAASLFAGSLAGSGDAVRVSSDGSTQQVEALRGAAALFGGPVDDSYYQVEVLRGAAALSGASVDGSYDRVEDIRATLPR